MRELIEVTLAAETRGWVLPTLLPLAPVIMAITTYFVTVEVGGNGFVAAFVCGVAFGGTVSNERGRSTSCSPSRSACCSVSVCGSSSVPASWQRSQGR